MLKSSIFVIQATDNGWLCTPKYYYIKQSLKAPCVVLQRKIGMNLIVRLQQIPRRDLAGNFNPVPTDPPLLICDRCDDVEAVVVAIMEIQSLEETWALCEACVTELPVGLGLA
jgi:hypothetical protein